MSLTLRNIIIPLALLGLLVACNRVPDYVIPPDDMAEVMADLNEGESYLELNYSKFPDDSARMAFKQSILAKHGYDLAVLDTSLVWYGANLQEYDKVCEAAVKILEGRLNESSAVASSSSTVAVAGDSVDVWSGSRAFHLNQRSPSTLLSFNLESDRNWRSGDQYTWRAKFLNNRNDGNFFIVADYTDGTTEYLSSRFGGDGWREMTFFSDSTRTPMRIYGVMTVQPKEGTSVYLDSVQLVRKRLNSQEYPLRYRQRTYKIPGQK